MSDLPTSLQVAILLAIVITLFNIIIFVHELGHFLAARWRGLRVDRFQIWFGKPLWSFKRNGVQYGLGWIPAGGFVALPQMAPMEAIEGRGNASDPLPPISPLDKIIVAFAGPLFSLLLALLCGCVVWKVGKPKDFVPTRIVGTVLEDSRAKKAGILPGDEILEVDGKPVDGFMGSLDSIFERVVLSTGDEIRFLVRRAGEPEPLTIVSGFDIPETKWWQRKGLRQVGIGPASAKLLAGFVTPDSPAARAGIQAGDEIVSMDGRTFFESSEAVAYIQSKGTSPIEIIHRRGTETMTAIAAPLVPIKPAGSPAMLGIRLFGEPFHDERMVYPGPFEQVLGSLRMMWTTVSSLITPGSSVGIGHLSGPVGIGSVMFEFLKMENGLQRILHFMVLFNVNLAMLNMLPLPVLDGGHITLAIGEAINKRPMPTKPLEIIQAVCAVLLMSLMLFVTSKDIADRVGPGGGESEEIIFPAP